MHSVRGWKEKQYSEGRKMALKNNLEYAIELKNIYKSFPGVVALNNVDFDLYVGEVHALVGENGAGKSTLIKIISGVYPADKGSIFLKGREVKFHSPIDSNAEGIKVVYQELNLVPELSVAENVFLGNFPINKVGSIDWKIMKEKTEEIISKLGLEVDPTIKVGSLRVAEQQIVEIARAISQGEKILIMDEPTSALSSLECQNLFNVILNLKNQGVSIIYITHKLEEIYQVAERVTIIRDGKKIATRDVKSTTIEELVSYMIGGELKNIFPKTDRLPKDIVFSVNNLKSSDIKDMSFNLCAGEVLGIYGLLGSGKEKLARILFGLEKASGGEVYIKGDRLKKITPNIALSKGISLITENRREEGIISILSVKRNMTLPSLGSLANKGWLFNKNEVRATQKFVKRLNIKTPSLEQEIMYLSGGNQQKVILARWLLHEQQVLIVVEPTRGIDVGSKAEIHKIIDEMANQGVAIIMVSSEIDEIIGLSDRIIVMRNGMISNEFNRKEALKEKIMLAAVGGAK